MISIVFFGTSPFAVPALEALSRERDFKILGVVTQAAKPVGRTQKIMPGPVAMKAKILRAIIFTPEKIKSLADELKKMKPDCLVVVAYGQILPEEILRILPLGAFNVHPSLLPKYRGASPVQGAIHSGEKETGVSVMLMDKELDHGPILSQEKIAINEHETAPELLGRLSEVSATALVKTIKDYAAGKIKPVVQDHQAATFTKILNREDGRMNFKETTEQVYNQWRGYFPWPGVYALDDQGRAIKFLVVRKTEEILPAAPGTLLARNKQLFLVCRSGLLEVMEIQLEGGKVMEAADFVNGYKTKLPLKLK